MSLQAPVPKTPFSSSILHYAAIISVWLQIISLYSWRSLAPALDLLSLSLGGNFLVVSYYLDYWKTHMCLIERGLGALWDPQIINEMSALKIDSRSFFFSGNRGEMPFFFLLHRCLFLQVILERGFSGNFTGNVLCTPWIPENYLTLPGSTRLQNRTRREL